MKFLRRSHNPIVIASRQSSLARAQAEFVAEAVGRRHNGVPVHFNWIESEGDRYSGELAEIGGKGLFARAIERALFDKEADLAVHSMKDLPAAGTAGLITAAVPVREDPRDVLVGPGISKIDDLPDNAIVQFQPVVAVRGHLKPQARGSTSSYSAGRSDQADPRECADAA